MEKEQGFTLIELMVVIAIIAMLSAVGIPAYQGYLRKAALTDMLQTFNHQRNAVELCLITQGGLTHCQGGAHDIPLTTTSRFISDTQVVNGTIALKGRDLLEGLVVTSTPQQQSPNGSLVWTYVCLAADNPPLKAACDALFESDRLSNGARS